MSPRANVLADTGLRAGLSLSLEEFKNFMRGVALLSGKLLILYQQFFNTERVWPKNNGGGRLGHSVFFRGRIRKRFFYGHTGEPFFPRALPESLLFKAVILKFFTPVRD